MTIKILVDPHRGTRPAGAIRCDIAWKLFIPDHMGDLPEGDGARVSKLVNWLWDELSNQLGFLRKSSTGTTWVITPPLSEAGRDLTVRICSMWSDEVYMVSDKKGPEGLEETGENLWAPPVLNVYGNSEKDAAAKKLTANHHGNVTRYLMPALGSTKAFMRTYRIPNGSTYARLHSHSAVEEHYLVLEGKGTLRTGDHSVAVGVGDLVSKPIGPDGTSQFVADLGVELLILDIEVWPDTSRTTKDLVHYPDHGEIFLRGQGWSGTVPSDALMDADDFRKNYDYGYRRSSDGKWSPKEVPGLRRREK